MRLIWLLMATIGLTGLAAQTVPSHWAQPASALADQIAAILGPGQARLTIRNVSTIPADEIPTIRRLLVEDLKARGVSISGVESASTVRVTLSQSAHSRVWVAEIGEGNQTQVAMVDAGPLTVEAAAARDEIELHREIDLRAVDLSLGLPAASGDPVLALLETAASLVVLRENSVMIFANHRDNNSSEEVTLNLDLKRPMPRDPRGVLIPAAGNEGFIALTSGSECDGSFEKPADPAARWSDGWSVRCRAIDDPWPIAINGAAASPIALKAFYNAARNYFTGVVSPSLGVDLPPFYTAVPLLRQNSGSGLLVGGIDGKVQLAENNTLHAVSGTRDWGSDFAALHSGCGEGTQIVTSSSGEAANDSLRAYALPALEAVPVSAPLAMDGTVMALWTAPDGKSVLAAVRNAANQYEVDRVTALCN